MRTKYNEKQKIDSVKGWLMYDTAWKCFKTINSFVKGKNVLDFGCGSGVMVDMFRIFRPDLNIMGTENEIKLSYHTIYSSHVLEHVDNPYEIIEKLIKKTKRIIIIVPDGNVNDKNLGTPHRHTFNRKNFLKIFEDFENIKLLERVYYGSILDNHMNSLIYVGDILN